MPTKEIDAKKLSTPNTRFKAFSKEQLNELKRARAMIDRTIAEKHESNWGWNYSLGKGRQ
ncbi:MAG: hypothetical protein B6229_00415 [Spirochaetaceae bacterium 4572_7]|nr:MAG: hypothetical protein B6229_00415 [Spirochaetaceae bacterium 4572_7]